MYVQKEMVSVLIKLEIKVRDTLQNFDGINRK